MAYDDYIQQLIQLLRASGLTDEQINQQLEILGIQQHKQQGPSDPLGTAEAVYKSYKNLGYQEEDAARLSGLDKLREQQAQLDEQQKMQQAAALDEQFRQLLSSQGKKIDKHVAESRAIVQMLGSLDIPDELKDELVASGVVSPTEWEDAKLLREQRRQREISSQQPNIRELAQFAASLGLSGPEVSQLLQNLQQQETGAQFRELAKMLGIEQQGLEEAGALRAIVQKAKEAGVSQDKLASAVRQLQILGKAKEPGAAEALWTYLKSGAESSVALTEEGLARAIDTVNRGLEKLGLSRDEIRYLADFLSPSLPAAKALKAADALHELSATNLAKIQEMKKEVGLENAPAAVQALGSSVEFLGQQIPQLVGYALGGAPGVLAAGLLANTGEASYTLRSYGVDDPLLALGAGSIVTAIDALSMGSGLGKAVLGEIKGLIAKKAAQEVVEDTLGKAALKAASETFAQSLKKSVKSAGIEGVTEVLQDAVEQSAAALASGDWEKFANEFWDNAKSTFADVALGTLIGASPRLLFKGITQLAIPTKDGLVTNPTPNEVQQKAESAPDAAYAKVEFVDSEPANEAPSEQAGIGTQSVQPQLSEQEQRVAEEIQGVAELLAEPSPIFKPGIKGQIQWAPSGVASKVMQEAVPQEVPEGHKLVYFSGLNSLDLQNFADTIQKEFAKPAPLTRAAWIFRVGNHMLAALPEEDASRIVTLFEEATRKRDTRLGRILGTAYLATDNGVYEVKNHRAVSVFPSLKDAAESRVATTATARKVFDVSQIPEDILKSAQEIGLSPFHINAGASVIMHATEGRFIPDFSALSSGLVPVWRDLAKQNIVWIPSRAVDAGGKEAMRGGLLKVFDLRDYSKSGFILTAGKESDVLAHEVAHAVLGETPKKLVREFAQEVERIAPELAAQVKSKYRGDERTEEIAAHALGPIIAELQAKELAKLTKGKPDLQSIVKAARRGFLVLGGKEKELTTTQKYGPSEDASSQMIEKVRGIFQSSGFSKSSYNPEAVSAAILPWTESAPGVVGPVRLETRRAQGSQKTKTQSQTAAQSPSAGTAPQPSLENTLKQFEDARIIAEREVARVTATAAPLRAVNKLLLSLRQAFSNRFAYTEDLFSGNKPSFWERLRNKQAREMWLQNKDRARYFIDDHNFADAVARYVTSEFDEIYDDLLDVFSNSPRAKSAANQLNTSIDDLINTWFFLRRQAFEKFHWDEQAQEWKPGASPTGTGTRGAAAWIHYGIDDKEALRQFDQLNQLLGQDVQKALESAAKRIVDLIQFMADKMEQSMAFSPRVIDFIRKNPYYVAFSMPHEFPKHPVEVEGVKVSGWVERIGSTDLATLPPFQMAAQKIANIIMNAAHLRLVNSTLLEAVRQGHAIEGTGKPMFRDLARVQTVIRGERRNFLVPRVLADQFDPKSPVGYMIQRAINDVLAIIRGIYIETSVVFLGHNPIRDIKGTIKNVRELFGPKEAAAILEAYREYFRKARARKKGERIRLDPWEKEVLRLGAIPGESSGSFVELGFAMNETKSVVERGIERLLSSSVAPIKWVGMVLDTLRSVANAQDYAIKLAGFRPLSMVRGEIPGSISQYTVDAVRNLIGTPNFRKTGRLTPFLQFVYPFINVRKEAYKAVARQLQRDPYHFALRFTVTSAVPAIAKVALKSGVALAIYDLLRGEKDKDDWFRKVLLLYTKVYRLATPGDLRNKQIIPLWVDDKGKAWYIALPMDHAGQFIHNIVYRIFDGFLGEKGDGSFSSTIHDVLSYLAGEIPSLNPLLQLAVDLTMLGLGFNPPDLWRGGYKIRRKIFEARDPQMWKDLFLRDLQQNLGPTLGPLTLGLLGDEDLRQKFMAAVRGTIPGAAILRVSDYGVRAEVAERMKRRSQEQARKSLAAERIILDAIKDGHGWSWVVNQSKEQGLFRDLNTVGKIKTRLRAMAKLYHFYQKKAESEKWVPFSRKEQEELERIQKEFEALE
jgi:hypothetical protein